MAIPTSVRELVARGPLAHLTTINPDGSPQVTLVWIGIENDEFVCAHMDMRQKLRNIQRDPRVALSMLGGGKGRFGLDEYLVVYGQARITEGGAAALLQRLAHIYMGPEAVFPPEPIRSKPGYITRITALRFSGVGPWAEAQG